MDIQEVIQSMEVGGYLVYCPGSGKHITILEYIQMLSDQEEGNNEREYDKVIV